ncbi:WYL domain-containing protein [bacterium]|nr:WYL domain-containing protein [bacterium]
MEAVEKGIDLLQLNLTGMRVIILFSLLLESPKTIDEINSEYEQSPLIREKVSPDTIRNDINSLRDAGCVISRTTKSNNKYALLKHPFELNLNESEIKSLKKIYNKIYTTLSFNELFSFDEFFQNIISYTKDEQLKEEIAGISRLSGIDRNILKDLIKYSKSKNQIKILYVSQNGQIKEHNLIAEKVGFRHDKLYLFCIDLDYNKNAFYHVSKIVNVLEIKLKAEKKDFQKFKAKYKLLNISQENYAFSDNEKLVGLSGNDLIIEAETENDFIMMQNILGFGKNCEVLEPLEFRNKIISTIKAIRRMYDNEK